MAKNTNNNGMKFRSANIHICGACNYRCEHCFSKNLSMRTKTPEDWVPVLEYLASAGIEKVNFVGGEPLLYKHLDEVCVMAKSLGFTVSVVSNGSLITEDWIVRMKDTVDWLGLSIDSPDDADEIPIGRHFGNLNHIENVKKVARMARENGMKVKLNITVVKRSCRKDFRPLIEEISADRVKVFRALVIEGANECGSNSWTITDEEFSSFVDLHRGCRNIVFEDNEDMVGTYLMFDPQGRWMQNNGQVRTFEDFGEMMENGAESALDVEKYYERNGVYDWKRDN